MSEPVIKRFLESRSRRWFVIILTLGVGLAGGLPAVDDYFATRARRGALAVELAKTRAAIEPLEGLERQIAKTRARLAKLERHTVPDSRVHAIRRQVAETARRCNCQMRRVRAATPQVQPWPDENKGDNGQNTTPYKLRTRLLSLAVSGSLEGVKQFLAKLGSNGLWMQTKSLALRPDANEGGAVELELEIVLFELMESTPAT